MTPRRPLCQYALSRAIALGACLGLGTKAWGQDNAVLPEVVVTGQRKPYKPEILSSPKYTVPLRDVPQTINVVPQEAIQEQNATTLREVLRNVPGISMQAGEGGVPAGDNLSIRGFNARTDIFVDGVRDFGGYSRDAFNIDQVEVSKGPSSSYGGRGSTGGAVNLSSKSPALDAFYGGTLGFGSADFQRTTLDLNQPIPSAVPGMAVRLNVMRTHANVPGRREVTSERWGVAPSLAFGLGTPTRVILGYFHLDQNNLPDYGIPWVPATNIPLAAYRDKPAPVDFKNFYGLRKRDYEKTSTDMATAQIQHDFVDWFSLRSLLRYGRNDRDSVVAAPRFANPLTTAITRELQSRDQVDSILTDQTDLTLKFPTGRLKHVVVTGAEVARENSENYARSGPAAPFADLQNPDPNDPYAGPIQRTGAKTEATAKSVGVYAFDTLTLTPWWDVTGGLRWDRFAVDYESRDVAGVVTPLERTDEKVNYRAGMVFKPFDNGNVYVAYGTSFNPSAEALTLGSAATSANNFNVAPEESRSYEVGTKWDAADYRLALNAAIFRTEKTNARTEDPTNPNDVIVLEGKQRVQGFEVGATGKVTDRWTLLGGYTFLDSEVRASRNTAEIGRQLSNTPKHSMNAWSTYALPWSVDVGAGVQYIASRVNSTATPRWAPSYYTFDAMVAYRANEHCTLRLNLYNLADEKYLDRIGGGHVVPGARRSVTLTTEVKFL